MKPAIKNNVTVEQNKPRLSTPYRHYEHTTPSSQNIVEFKTPEEFVDYLKKREEELTQQHESASGYDLRDIEDEIRAIAREIKNATTDIESGINRAREIQPAEETGTIEILGGDEVPTPNNYYAGLQKQINDILYNPDEIKQQYDAQQEQAQKDFEDTLKFSELFNQAVEPLEGFNTFLSAANGELKNIQPLFNQMAQPLEDFDNYLSASNEELKLFPKNLSNALSGFEEQNQVTVPVNNEGTSNTPDDAIANRRRAGLERGLQQQPQAQIQPVEKQVQPVGNFANFDIPLSSIKTAIENSVKTIEQKIQELISEFGTKANTITEKLKQDINITYNAAPINLNLSGSYVLTEAMVNNLADEATTKVANGVTSAVEKGVYLALNGGGK